MRFVLIAWCLLIAASSYANEEQDHAVHQELRSLLQSIEQAINTGKYQDLAAYFHENLRVTTLNQQVITSRDGIADYFKTWFGPGGYLRNLKITLTPDALTELYNDNTFGIVRGSGNEDYNLVDGRHLAIKTRWTATVTKDEQGKWRILALHIGTNFYRNPIVDALVASQKYFAVGGFAGGILFCGIVYLFMRRRKKTTFT